MIDFALRRLMEPITPYEVVTCVVGQGREPQDRTMPHKPTSPHTPAPPPTRGRAPSWGRRRGEREEMVVGMRRPGAHAPGSMMPPLRGFRNRLSDGSRPTSHRASLALPETAIVKVL